MSTIMSQLHLDHLSLSRLLDVLKDKLVSLKAGENPDYQLILDVITYIVDYADAHHHPLEDQIYDYAIQQYPSSKQALAEVAAEHKQIRDDTREFQQLIESILMDSVVSMDIFNQRLEDFICRQYDHLNHEEGKIFPMLEKLLQGKDWLNLQVKLQTREDPLFGDNVAEEYKRLYKSLIQENAVA
ncbi:hemerythrin domain-containing protein [Oceanospirillum linum]|uniref:hemerythrin domain-containing protein n=1 Tax=Oceanospirillum linum TaxID=966 RepID=UPI00089E8B2F|nr:hemerythrin domain-containing protein [Oceanospirillum linum]SEG11381.1 Hemerythrin-like domain-containing protein [Oleiphilus messinensis]SMP09205.1 Hemerythrin-like domain-containing protein [Oceanospirillum linum]